MMMGDVYADCKRAARPATRRLSGAGWRYQSDHRIGTGLQRGQERIKFA